MAKDTLTPVLVTPAKLMSDETVSGFNDASLRDADRQSFESADMPYNYTTDQGLASRRSKQIVRTHAEVSAACSGPLPLGDGLSLRAPMAGQCENDQFIFSTDQFGKQRS